jgi:outer membrane protein assembly factor BamD
MKLSLFYRGLLTAALLSVMGLFDGCGSSKPKDVVGDCRVKFDKLHDEFEKKKYSTAKEGYDDFVVACSGTDLVEQAYFELAQSHFALEEWMEAEEEYEAFLKEYPNSGRFGETVHYRLAVSMANQTQISQRDQTKTVDAIHEFEDFIAAYPDSPLDDSARTELETLHGLLADHDMRIASLYRRMGEPLAAVVYYKHILNQYGDEVPRRDVTLKMVECYIALQQFVEAQTLLSQFDGVAKDDPFRDQIKAMQHKLDVAQARYARQKEKEKKDEQRQKQVDSTYKST